jgi:acetamidase/formamidase
MASHTFEPVAFYNRLGGPEPPVLALKSGDSVRTRTIDAHGFNEREEPVAFKPNPLTGPFQIAGAEAGDTLAVRLDELKPNRSSGWSHRYLAGNVLEPSLVRLLPEQDYARWKIDPQNLRASPVDPPASLAGLTMPMRPFLGCIGTAPADGQTLSSATAGPHGGNMDYPGISEGATIYLPVFVPGARLYLGDGHAAQGDGEIAGSGIEVSFDVRFTVTLLKGVRSEWPRGENTEWLFTLGNARPLEQALQHATSEMVRWLEQKHGLDPASVGLLLGQAVRYELGNVYDPAYTMACKLPKWSLPKR